MRQVFVDTGLAGKLAEQLKVDHFYQKTVCERHRLMRIQTDSSEDEMVASRILFLSTYDTNLDFEGLIKNNSLGDNVNYVCLQNATMT